MNLSANSPTKIGTIRLNQLEIQVVYFLGFACASVAPLGLARSLWHAVHRPPDVNEHVLCPQNKDVLPVRT